jgi:hypothetical protein
MLTTVPPPASRLSRQCGILNTSQTYRPPRPVTGDSSFLRFLWSSGQSSWLQIQRSGFDSRHCQIFWEVMGLERGPLSLVSSTKELLDRKSSCSGLENREYCRRDPSRWPRCTLCPQKLALTSPTSGGRSVGIVRSRTQVTEFSFSLRFSFTCIACTKLYS